MESQTTLTDETISTVIKAGQEFYTQLASLFYAVAGTDGFVHENEQLVLRDIVSTEWRQINYDIDILQDDAHLQIEKAFTELMENSSAGAFIENFQRYKEKQPLLFSPSIVNLTWRTVERIAICHNMKNNEEIQVLKKVEEILFPCPANTILS